MRARSTRLYMFLVWLSVFFFLLIAGVATYSVIRFRHKPGDVRRTGRTITFWNLSGPLFRW